MASDRCRTGAADSTAGVRVFVEETQPMRRLFDRRLSPRNPGYVGVSRVRKEIVVDAFDGAKSVADQAAVRRVREVEVPGVRRDDRRLAEEHRLGDPQPE